MAKREPPPDFVEKSTKAVKSKESDDNTLLDFEEFMDVDGENTPARENKVKEDTSNKYKPLNPWKYQQELASAAIEGQNSIICAPTGSGKTLTAALVCKARSERTSENADNEPFKALFVVCLRSLVKQQLKSLGEVLPKIKVGCLEEGQFLDDALKEHDIVVITSQIAVNALRNNDIDLEKLRLIVFDECHHANLEHPYNQLMRIYHNKKMDGCKRLPQILGLTASLGVGGATGLSGAKDHYVTMCANLDCDLISHIRDPSNKAELEHYNPKPSPNQIIETEKRSRDKAFYKLMTEMMQKIEKKFLSASVELAERGTQTYEGRLSKLKLEAESSKERCDEMVACQTLMNINSAWMMHEELRAKDSLASLDKFFQNNLETKPGEVEKVMCEWYRETRKEIQSIVNQEKIDDWPLLKELSVLIKQLFDENFNSKGIIMANRIQCVDGLLDYFNDDPDAIFKDRFIRPGKFVGHRHDIDNSMTEKEQETIIKEFREGKKNLLIATNVAQEGLDIPTCNFVIRYDFVSNEIGSVQSQGRARAKDSKCFLISYKGSINVERELINLKKERLMQETLEAINDPNSTEELKELIKKSQDKLYEELRTQRNAMDVTRTVDREIRKYSLHCKRCKALICPASSLIKYGSHYVCKDENMDDRLQIEPMDQQHFREDSLIGKSVCSKCKGDIGSVLNYKRGNRNEGFTLGKKSVMWKVEGKDQYGAIKKWENVPFSILEEMRS